MNKQLTAADYLRIRKYIIQAICVLPFEQRETGYQTLDILLQLLSDKDLKKVVEITYNEYINPSVEV